MNKQEPKPAAPAGVPYAPRHLNAEGKKEWRRMVRLLMDLGLYTEVDRAALAIYCHAWGRWVIAEKKLQTEGEVLLTETGYHYQNPWRSEANRAMEDMRRIAAEFGLTPSARSRLQVPGAHEEVPSLAEQLASVMERAA